MIGPLVVAVVAIAIAVVVALCALGALPRNPVVGIRIPSFFASDEAWKAGHRIAAVPVSVAACVCIGLTFLAAGFPAYSGPVAVLVSLLVMLAGVVVGAVMGSRALRHVDQ